MLVPLSWLREHVDIPADRSARQISDALINLGLEVERVETTGSDLSGPVVFGRVLRVEELTGFKKPIRWCQVEVGEGTRGIVCGATNFAAGDTVVVALPGSVLPGGFAITARKTYGHVSDGMICSARELGVGDDHAGIMVVPGEHRPGVDAIDELGLRDQVLDIAVGADRGYCLSIRGVAREASHAFGTAFRDVTGAALAPDQDGWPVRIDDLSGCDRFSARTVTGIDPAAPTPMWMRTRLARAGMRPISLAVDVTNYVMLETGQPMHAFDRSALRGPLVVRRARAGERLTTLDGVDRELDPDDLLVANDDGPAALAGVMGGESTEISATTTDVVLEAARWEPTTIARSVRRHKLPSEAARRFERGVDPEIALVALARAAALLTEYGCGRSETGLTVVGEPYRAVPVELSADRPERVAGRPIDRDTVVESLTGVGCAVSGTDRLTVRPPSWRPDLTDPADLVEEVVRLVGYDTIPETLPRAPLGHGLTQAQRVRRSVGRAMAGAGYVEVLTYPFVSPDVGDALNLPADDPRRDVVRLVNPLSREEPDLRTSLLPGLFRALARNLGRGQRDLALYEVGLVYRETGQPGPAPVVGVDARPDGDRLDALNAMLPAQPRHAATVLTGAWEPDGWWGAGRPANWADAIESARVIAEVARVELSVRADVRAPWHPGRCAALVADDHVVGHAGELHPRVIAAFDLPERACAMELDLDALGIGEPPLGPVLSGFPPALLDVALVVDETVPAAAVEGALRDGGGELLEHVRLFDVYSGAQTGEGRRSLAFGLRMRAPDRTLTAAEANQVRDAAVAEASRRHGVTVRG